MHLSLDFFEYFEATAPLLDEDKTIYAVSSWNDHGQSQFVANATQVVCVGPLPPPSRSEPRPLPCGAAVPLGLLPWAGVDADKGIVGRAEAQMAPRILG